MSRAELNFNKDPETFRAFFGDEELQAENKRLYNILSASLRVITVYGRVLVLVFKNNVSVCIEYIEEGVFYLTLSDPSLYEYNDNPKTKLSKDRILHYLDYIGNVALLES